jgi:death-on-curing protein
MRTRGTVASSGAWPNEMAGRRRSLRPVFLELDEALALHASAIARFGGALGVRDAGALQSALAMPRASFDGAWLHPTIHEMAAAYLFHVAQNDPFVDGNKRAALATAIAFLGLNDLRLTAKPDDLYAMVMAVAKGEATKSAVALFFQANVRRLPMKRRRRRTR